MSRVIDVIHHLMPSGSVPGGGKSVRRCPDWPPDVFAVAATVVERNGVYTHPWFTAGWDRGGFLFGDAYQKEIGDLAGRWLREGRAPDGVRRLWARLLAGDEEQTEQGGEAPTPWQFAAVKLLAVADEASWGIGFAPGDDPSPFALFHLSETQRYLAGAQDLLLPHVPVSLCRAVDPTCACVQPKTNTPTVGCTLRSLSHNLALLPPLGVVETSWFYAHPEDNEAGPLNLLLVPFPYVLQGRDFVAEGESADPENPYFSVSPGWLEGADGTVGADRIAHFLLHLVAEAKREVSVIHGIVLPETALLEDQAPRIAELLAAGDPALELFVSGVMAVEGNRVIQPKNRAFTARLYHGRVLAHWTQAKHHRWRLDRGQICRYHLGHVLDPERNWWERIYVNERSCVFTVVRRAASLCVLICEDLARVDPVLPSIYAIGPNLVIALLMDGPQMKSRWPARYATVLAEDPGSAVLTLTCLGMIERSSMPGNEAKRQIALWKEKDGDAQELVLPPGCDALLLSLTCSLDEQVTLDLRSDDGAAQRFRMSAVRPVRARRDQFPDWPRFDG